MGGDTSLINPETDGGVSDIDFITVGQGGGDFEAFFIKDGTVAALKVMEHVVFANARDRGGSSECQVVFSFGTIG